MINVLMNVFVKLSLLMMLWLIECAFAEQDDSQVIPRAIMLQSYMYNAEPFQRPNGPPTTHIGFAVERARLAGVELWQVEHLRCPCACESFASFAGAHMPGGPLSLHCLSYPPAFCLSVMYAMVHMKPMHTFLTCVW